MTTSQIAKLFKARRSGKGKWQARCPVHGRDQKPSLSITDMGAGNTRLHCFTGCSQQAVLDAAGLSWGDLRPGEADPFWREQMEQRDRLALKERQHGLAIMAQAVLPGECNYWRVVERNLAVEIRRLRDTIYPSEKKDRERSETVQRIIAEYGWNCLWDCLPMARLQARLMNERKKEA